MIVCRLIGHKPALVREPCRCRRCGRMIRWDGNGGWRLTRMAEWYPRAIRLVAKGPQPTIVFDHVKGEVREGNGPLGY